MLIWARWRGDGHHEGNPDPDQMPLPGEKSNEDQSETDDE